MALATRSSPGAFRLFLKSLTFVISSLSGLAYLPDLTNLHLSPFSPLPKLRRKAKIRSRPAEGQRGLSALTAAPKQMMAANILKGFSCMFHRLRKTIIGLAAGGGLALLLTTGYAH